MNTSSVKDTQSANEIRSHFASFLSSIPRDQPQQPNQRQVNGVTQQGKVSTIREILNRKMEHSNQDQTKNQTKAVVFISQQVSKFQESLAVNKNELKNLQLEHLKIIKEYEEILSENSDLRKMEHT